jgi:uroporphyrinogen decarboxylase
MKELTIQERFSRVFSHKKADRVSTIDSPWRGTLERGKQEGMPDGIDWRDCFGVDKMEFIHADTFPSCKIKTLEETDDHIITTSHFRVGGNDEKLQACGFDP